MQPGCSLLPLLLLLPAKPAQAPEGELLLPLGQARPTESMGTLQKPCCTAKVGITTSTLGQQQQKQ